MNQNVVLTTLFAFLVSCSVKKQDPKKEEIVEHTITSEVSVKPAQPESFQATPEKLFDLIHTQLIFAVDLDKKSFQGTECVWLRPHFYKQNTLILDAKFLEIESIELISPNFEVYKLLSPSSVSRLDFEYKDSLKLKILLDKWYTRNEVVGLKIKYKAHPEWSVLEGSKAIKDAKGLYFISPNSFNLSNVKQVWTQGETESSSGWFPTIDKPNQKTTHYISITFDKNLTSLSNGVLVKSTINGASKTDEWNMRQPIAPYLFFFGVGDFAKVQDDKVNGKEVSYYVDRDYEKYAKEIYNHTPEMIRFFSDYTKVPFPWDKYSQMIAHEYVSGAMENTTATLHGEFVQKNHRQLLDSKNDDIVAHELFHQWFGDLATTESWSNLTLNESFATLGEILWYEYKYGKADGQKHALHDFQKYKGRSEMADPVLLRYYYHDKEELFDHVSYAKGGLILNMIRHQIGEDAFREAMRIYLTNRSFKDAEVAHWRMALEEVTGKDFMPFFNQWYSKSSLPILDVLVEYDDDKKTAKLNVSQNHTDSVGFYKFNSSVWIYRKSGIEKIPVEVNNKVFTISVPYIEAQRPIVVFNGDNSLVGIIKQNQDRNYWLELYKNSPNYLDKYNAISMLHKDSQNVEYQNALWNDVISVYPSVSQLAASNLIMNVLLDDQKEYLWLYVNDPQNNAATRSELLSKLPGHDHRMDLEKLVFDSSYAVASEALNSLYALDTVQARQMALKASNDMKSNLENSVLQILVLAKNKEDYSIFETSIQKNRGTGLLKNLGLFKEYLLGVNDFDLLKKGVSEFENIAINAPQEFYRNYAITKLYGLFLGFKKKNSITEADYIKEAILQRIIISEMNINHAENLKLGLPELLK